MTVTNTKKFSSCWANRTNKSGCYRDIRVLVVDCNPICLKAISEILKILTYEVLTAERGRDAMALVLDKERRVDVVLMELHLPDMFGFDLLDQIKRASDMPVLIMSFDGSDDSMVGSLYRGAEYYFNKPVSMKGLADIWQYVITRRQRQLKAEKKKAVVEDSSEGSHGDERSAVSDHRWDADEEDTLTSPLPKKARLHHGESSASGTAGTGDICSVEDEQLLIPPPLTPPQEQGMLKTSAAAEGEDDRESRVS